LRTDNTSVFDGLRIRDVPRRQDLRTGKKQLALRVATMVAAELVTPASPVRLSDDADDRTF